MPLVDEAPKSNYLISIELTNTAQFMKEVYFKDGQGSVFTYRETRDQLLRTLGLAALSGVFYVLSVFFEPVTYVAIFTILGFLAAVSFIWFLSNARKYFLWKASVDWAIKKAESYKKVALNVQANGLEVVSDDQIVIERWTNFNAATIGPTHILLSHKVTNYVFPAKSMKESEYEELSRIVRHKVINGEAVNDL